MGHLAVPQPYSFELSSERFRAFGSDRANLWHDGGLHRVVDGREVRIVDAPDGVEVSPLDGAVRPVVEKLLGLALDLSGFTLFAADEPLLAVLVQRLRGFRPPLVPDGFEALVTSISAQQVSLQSASATRSRLVERFGGAGTHARAFPTEDGLAGASEEDLLALGFSRRKAEYVLALARDPLPYAALAGLPDAEVKAAIEERRGLGEWTADWFLARHLARPRAWPAGDLGLRRAVSVFYGEGRDLTSDQVRALGRRFAPYENLAAHYLLLGLRTVSP